MRSQKHSRPRQFHGATGTRLYNIWKAMMRRCYVESHVGFSRYGGRGIKVCDEWHIFNNFKRDMVLGYGEDLCIDRIDNDKGYELSNCRWTTPLENNNNRVTSKFIAFNGETKTASNWARQIGITDKALRMRLRKWPLEKALLTPSLLRKSKENTINN